MCTCNGTGVITNNVGFGMYGKYPCSCAAGERSREELDQHRQVLMKNLEIACQMQKEGTWDAEAHRRFAERRLYDSSTTKKVHETIAS
ncbi:hypothetical protein [Bacillus cereus group sp. BfR-BA-01380]|uniref:hypothetical protein n=1 Tax=Bacillus cereus group sp. BfR-BA-01380 TaxID=2920324 RepID=UPI001F5829FF|nr:hypothetical protein [Bacillus cereus group sp. BfR-BA-01380]